MINGITYLDNFLSQPQAALHYLISNIVWDERMTARKTASYGVAYNYSQMSYPYFEMLPILEDICNNVNLLLGFKPNNCLINYYANGNSKMGFHSDQTDILAEGTGVVIVSLGASRILRFRNVADHAVVQDYELSSGSLLYMTKEVQSNWQHAIPKTDNSDARISLTLRKIH